MNKKCKVFLSMTAALSVMSSMSMASMAVQFPAEIPVMTTVTERKKPDFGLSDQARDSLREAMRTSVKQATDSLVKAGTLTQEQADKILAHDKEIFKNLSAEQKSALKSAMQQARKAALTDLVKKGTLTQEQANQLQQHAEHHKCPKGDSSKKS